MTLDIQSQIVPPAIVDIIVEAHRAPRPCVDQDLPRYELHPELNLLLLREHGEKESAVDAMHGQTEEQGEVDGGVVGRDDGAQRHLDARPRGEDDPGLEGDDAVGDRAGA